MESILTAILCIIAAVGIALALLPTRQFWRKAPTIWANDAGTHAGGKITRYAEGALSTRYVLMKKGTANDEVLVCGASDMPIGVLTDEAYADRDPVNITLLGSADRTLLMVASEEIAVGAYVFTAANGKVQDLPAGAGTYYCVGIAVTAAGGDGDLLEVDPCQARAVVVSG